MGSSTADDDESIPPLGVWLVAVVFAWIFLTNDLLNSLHEHADIVAGIASVIIAVAITVSAIYVFQSRGFQAGWRWLLGEDSFSRRTVRDVSAKHPSSRRSVGSESVSMSTEKVETVDTSPSKSQSSTLNELPEEAETVDTSSSKSQSITIDKLREVSPYEFEEFVAELWGAIGWDATVTSGSADGNIDVIAEHDMATGEGRKNREMIQVKQKSKGNKVGVKTVRATRGSERVNPRDRLVIVTTGTFTSVARDAAEKNDVELIDKNKLEEMIREHKGDIKWDT
jgi:Predicted endonuclease distantly related to archaeal Holliday junction resolvase and Mrr-like restriction enzymes